MTFTRNPLFDFPVTTIDGVAGTLEPYRGKVLLVVNVASKCGFTPQYAGLEALYLKYRDRGFEVLGFPCDQFLNQEPGSEADIKAFCSLKYAVTFPMYAKVKVNGPDAHPLYEYLKSQQRGTLGTESIKWNFTKFLVDRSGTVVRRFGMFATPSAIDKHVEKLLG
jgi:glutathione peroxidase